MLSDKSRAEILRIQGEYPDPHSALLPALLLAQENYGGWLPDAALVEVAGEMGLPPSLVKSTASFYTMLFQRPVGRHLIQVCTNIACSLLGAESLMEHLKHRLGVSPGETTPDGRLTLLEVECLGSCGTAPAMQVDGRTCENLTAAEIDRILAELT